MFISNFHSIRPPFETSQKDTLEWLLEAHCYAGADREELSARLARVACKPDRIAKRGHVIPDYLHRDWEKMEIFGKKLDRKTLYFAQHADRVLEQFYEKEENPPDDLIHVTCTGYSSPSAAQKIVAFKNWGEQTTVTHAYHMGCYGSIPALRMAKAFLLSEKGKQKIDIVHTEICSLHINPSNDSSQQLVTESLFADGFIKYSLSREGPGLQVLTLREEIIPNSNHVMSWNVSDWGFEMSLSKEVPILITRHLPNFLARMKIPEKKALFAIHPGGPKILDAIQKTLGLEKFQMEFSFRVLEQFGNMSSATLPHIWKLIQEEAEAGTPVISLAFGPGLSICGMYSLCGGQQ